MLGGRTAGDTKARLADANGRCRLKLKDHKTRKTIHITFVVFLRLLTLMHQRRQGGAAKPWLTVRDMPDNAGVPSAEAKLAINIMRTTKFSHPDRYQDRVSMEILDAMRRTDSINRAIAISLAVRYKSSPRCLSAALVSATSAAFKTLVRESANGVAYEQTGNTKVDLASGSLVSRDERKGHRTAPRPYTF